MNDLKKNIIEELKKIKYPDFNRDIISFGILKDIVIDKNNIKVSVWERGAGLTKACGTAACATAVASFSKNLTEREVHIAFDQGSLQIKYDSNKNIFMTGPVSKIKKVDISI